MTRAEEIQAQTQAGAKAQGVLMQLEIASIRSLLDTVDSLSNDYESRHKANRTTKLQDECAAQVEYLRLEVGDMLQEAGQKLSMAAVLARVAANDLRPVSELPQPEASKPK